MRSTLLISILFFLASCSQRTPLSKEQRTKVETEVKAMLLSYVDDIKKDGLMAEFKYLDSSADFFWMPPGSGDSIRYEAIASMIRDNATLLTSVVNTYDTLEILPISEAKAMYTATVRSVTTDTSGKIDTTLLFENGIVVKRNDGWKLIAGKTTIKNNK